MQDFTQQVIVLFRVMPDRISDIPLIKYMIQDKTLSVNADFLAKFVVLSLN
ncbi:hypothetical protein ACP0AK_12155 [Listeria ivanovii]|uniref:Uncharacterized protein n=1 Tax=Listeria ivanovii (strain ATCC BAA-678 / PAM 55) TaxID=881621 RepID=G2Z9Z3_LISIP|nr:MULTISPECIES: hypothetical protein [Listeria]MBC1760279.1 hypothetical protein [Listeria ivanovii]MBC2254382.1 hypothetical protein [Listeria ivanovii]MBK3915333.1 hypothetical protein [Listeria ivanovii subsp. ivanovii]MBK3922461.1 hypothetical protein [Listeria ivanovii subsp. ivanovii]MBK3927621.1 hypothetical protein [Listeria ivanovii subsp. ivanovii]